MLHQFRRVRESCACVAAAAILATAMGCGGDDQGTAAGGEREYEVASESPDRFIARMAKTLETAKTKKDCTEIDRINARSLTRFPCPAPTKFKRSLARFEVVGAKAYGTGAVVDYTSGRVKDGAAIVLIAAPNRGWGVSRFGVVTEPSTNTDDEQSRPGFRKAIDAYLAAIRARDCEAYMDVRVIDGGGGKSKVCATLFRGTKVLLDRMKDDPGATLEYQGGNSVYGFFTLETSKPTPLNMTFSVVKANADAASPYVVLDAGPSPTAKQQREVVKQYERNKAHPPSTEPAMSPSSKAD